MRKPICPSIIDIEASGFGSYSYPIEIGVVTATGERYCALIKPQENWNHWCEQAQQVHGISREVLDKSGRAPRQICAELNKLLDGSTCYSDAWTHDSPWLNRLFFAARTNPSFHLSPIEIIATEEQLGFWDDTKQKLQVQLSIKRHRASGDAYLIQQTYLKSRQRVADLANKAGSGKVF